MLKNSLEEKWMYEPKEGEQFFFMHIPKSGGTTFRKMLTNHFPEGSYYPTQKDLMSNNGKYFSQKDLINDHQEVFKKPIIMGHYNVHLIKHLNPNVKVAVFLRSPIDRILSHIKHMLRNNPEYVGMDPNTLIEQSIGKLSGLQSRVMGYWRNNFEDVVENLNSIDFIGILEYYDESVALFNQMFEYNFESVSPQNKSTLQLENVSAQSMSLISESITVELQTYGKACELFRERCKANQIELSNHKE